MKKILQFNLIAETYLSIIEMVLTQVELEKVTVHPLVLLSVVDHFNRMKKIGNQKRVVGLLLGSWSGKGNLDIANSFAIPFDEDDKDRDVWFLDHEYLENMYNMFRSVDCCLKNKYSVICYFHSEK